MATIKIFDLRPTGSDLLSDSEGYQVVESDDNELLMILTSEKT
ncbi:hypothetical protein [Nostoc sp. ChiSLP03a]|nr:hypothetical protein [Nostoc sp. ChiSLP03a]MDZ8216251.1 hypothetical protein [Nostoc sp. ChiSLP03a]